MDSAQNRKGWPICAGTVKPQNWKVTNTLKILSLGAGVNSTALLLLSKPDKVVFADTGSEKPGTYVYIEKYIKPYCGDRFVTVRREGKSKYAVWPLHEYYEKKARVPFRQNRETTVMWKLRPLYKWVKANANPCEMLIGIDAGEIHRMRDSGVPWITNQYPLIDAGMRRANCEEVIRKHGWPIPEKSGCWCCPFNSLAAWQDLKLRYPELYKRAMVLEESMRTKWNCSASFHPSGPLIQLDKRFADQSLDSFESEECSGTCFT